jgi:hypothetical protein
MPARIPGTATSPENANNAAIQRHRFICDLLPGTRTGADRELEYIDAGCLLRQLLRCCRFALAQR